MITVAIESPFRNYPQALEYLDACILDCLSRGETPYASHKMLTTALDDSDAEQRQRAIEVGLAMAATLDRRVFYVDRGVSWGMTQARRFYYRRGLSFEERRLGGKWALARPRVERGAHPVAQAMIIDDPFHPDRGPQRHG